MAKTPQMGATEADVYFDVEDEDVMAICLLVNEDLQKTF